MGKQSKRENKTIYQICREEAGLTRSEASEKMTAVSDSKIEKFEYEIQEPTPYDIIQMADAYRRPDLCNYYCSHKCEIGHRYVPEVKVSDLSNIILETIASLNEINPLKVHALPSHISATFTRFLQTATLRLCLIWQTYQAEPSLICDFCPSDQEFAYSFLQILPYDRHPCCSAIHFLVA